MIRKILISVLVLVVGGFLLSSGAVQAQDISMTFASAYAEDDHQTQSLIKFAELVEEKTDGEVQINVQYGGVLGGERDVAENIQLGGIEGAILGGILQGFDEALAILEFPFLFDDDDHIHRVMDGPIGTVINERMQENINMRSLDIIMRTPRQLTTNDPVENLDDLQGMSIRVPEMEAHLSTWEALGAEPTPLSFTEVYTALQTGTVDGQENPIPVIYANRFQEVADYLAMTSHLPGFMMIVINDDIYRDLSYEHRIAFNEAAAEARQFNDELLEELMEDIMAELEEAMTITEPDREEFRSAADGVWENFEDVDGFTELYWAIRELSEE